MEKQNMKIIHIDWEGPYKLSELNVLTDEAKDYGIYQIYGKHNVYGNGALLYIGMADFQTVGKRISQENWLDTNDSNNHSIYIGRVAGTNTPTEEEWSLEINLAEQLLIYVHKPAYNSKNLTSIQDLELQHIHILNQGFYRDLFPEVSGLRWTSALNDMKYDIYRLIQSEITLYSGKFLVSVSNVKI